MTQAELFHSTEAAPAQPVTVSSEVREAREEDAPFHFEGIEPERRAPYIVRLVDYPAVDGLKVAEQRFRRELDRQLGADVVPALRAFQNASESGESELTKDEMALAKRWIKAFDAARTAGFRELGDTDEAFFDVRPV